MKTWGWEIREKGRFLLIWTSMVPLTGGVHPLPSTPTPPTPEVTTTLPLQ